MGSNNISKERLMEIGLKAITNFHDIYRDLGFIESLAKGNDAIKEKCKNIRQNLEVIGYIKRQQEMKAVEYTISELCNKVKKYFNYEFADRLSINVIEDFKVKLPGSTLTQILINLVDNAGFHAKEYLDFDKKDIIQCCLTVDKDTIIVSDSGTGISDEIKDKIFELGFTTKEIGKTSTHGGIGLYAVMEHCKKLNINLEVKNNTILKGANFYLTFNKYKLSEYIDDKQ